MFYMRVSCQKIVKYSAVIYERIQTILKAIVNVMCQ